MDWGKEASVQGGIVTNISRGIYSLTVAVKSFPAAFYLTGKDTGSVF
jgi:hypothetical protein